MLYRNVEEYIFNIENEAELDEYRTLKDNLDEAFTHYEESVDGRYAVITLKKPNWRNI